MNVVFTGKGIDPLTGKLKTRDEWSALANNKGFGITNAVNGRTQYLVASRDDTVKAAAAKANGVSVISYNDFYAMVCGAVPVADKFDATPIPKLNTAGMEEIEGWGMF